MTATATLPLPLISAERSRSFPDQDGNTVDATAIVATYRALSLGAAEASDGSKDEL